MTEVSAKSLFAQHWRRKTKSPPLPGGSSKNDLWQQWERLRILLHEARNDYLTLEGGSLHLSMASVIGFLFPVPPLYSGWKKLIY